jgi:hypothetical protein
MLMRRFQEMVVTVTLRCLNCGFTFTVTYPTAHPAEDPKPVACGHCRSTRWASQAA